MRAEDDERCPSCNKVGLWSEWEDMVDGKYTYGSYQYCLRCAGSTWNHHPPKPEKAEAE